MSLGDEIVRIAARGEGVTASGRHVAMTAPGDRVSDSGAITPGAQHQAPLCRHYGTCGGCQLQHITDTAYATYLTDRIISALHAQGLDAPTIAPPILSPPHSRRRVALRALRRGKQVTLGFAQSGSHTLVDLRECPVMQPALFALIQPLRKLLVDLMRDKRGADIRMTCTDQGTDILIAGVEVEGLAATEVLATFAATHRLARLSLDEGYGPTARWEPDPVTITLSGVAVALPYAAFLQATVEGEAALVSAVGLMTDGAEHVADLFAGLGTFALAQRGAVHAVEGARDAALALQMAANRHHRAVVTEHRDLFRRPLTPAELAKFDAVILDPPRAGALEQIAHLAESAVPKIGYVSCNPATFARDAKTLVDGGYRLDQITPVGQFRWSTHTELAAAFVR